MSENAGFGAALLGKVNGADQVVLTHPEREDGDGNFLSQKLCRCSGANQDVSALLLLYGFRRCEQFVYRRLYNLYIRLLFVAWEYLIQCQR